MSRREIAILCCKLLALWAFVEAAMSGAGAIMAFAFTISTVFSGNKFVSSDLAGDAIIGIPTLGAVVIGILLWKCAPWLATKMVGTDPSPVSRPGIDQESILSVALSAIGVWTLIPALRDLAGSLIRAAGSQYQFRDYWHNSTWQGRFWSSIIGLTLAIWLIFGSRGVARIVLKLRRPEPDTVSAPGQS